jgi:hypothetical protein
MKRRQHRHGLAKGYGHRRSRPECQNQLPRAERSLAHAKLPVDVGGLIP